MQMGHVNEYQTVGISPMSSAMDALRHLLLKQNMFWEPQMREIKPLNVLTVMIKAMTTCKTETKTKSKLFLKEEFRLESKDCIWAQS